MKFNFKNSDMVRCEVLRNTVIARQNVLTGTIVDVDGWTAKQLMSGTVPALKQVPDYDPVPLVERDTELIVSTPDPVKAPPAPAPKVKPKAKTKGDAV
jgi:hypothetical protein